MRDYCLLKLMKENEILLITRWNSYNQKTIYSEESKTIYDIVKYGGYHIFLKICFQDVKVENRVW